MKMACLMKKHNKQCTGRSHDSPLPLSCSAIVILSTNPSAETRKSVIFIFDCSPRLIEYHDVIMMYA